MKKLAFTLSEVMIALTVIGIISAVAIPVALQSAPDKNILKFKKGHATIYKVINQLIASDKYYKDGDLGIKANGEQIYGGFYNPNFPAPAADHYGNNPGNIQYFCRSFADLISTKTVNCSTVKTAENDCFYTFIEYNKTLDPSRPYIIDLETAKQRVDNSCKDKAGTVGSEIVTSDGITYYQTNPQATFGIEWDNLEARLFPPSAKRYGLYPPHKIFCMDVDGIPAGGSASCDDKEDICPFGYGIRGDGKILTGARADEWLKKDAKEESE